MSHSGESNGGPSSTQQQQRRHSPYEGIQSYIAGLIAGLGKVAAGHPFDTIKARLQSGAYAGPVSAVRGTLVREGPLGFYRGVSMPTFNYCFLSGIVFYVNAAIQRLIQPDASQALSYSQMTLAGAGAGLAAGLVANPIELVKVNLQTTQKITAPSPSSSVSGVAAAGGGGGGTPSGGGALASNSGRPSTIRAVVRAVGIQGLLTTGLGPTLVREIVFTAIFFPANQFFKDVLHLRRERHRRQLSSSASEVAVTKRVDPISSRVIGAWLAGVVAWAPVYPVDCVKTRMQINAPGTYRGMWHCARCIYKELGFRRGFLKGIEPCLLRAGPAYAANFTLYETVMAYFAAWEHRHA